MSNLNKCDINMYTYIYFKNLIKFIIYFFNIY